MMNDGRGTMNRGKEFRSQESEVRRKITPFLPASGF
jgi:hypothetical protein